MWPLVLLIGLVSSSSANDKLVVLPLEASKLPAAEAQMIDELIVDRVRRLSSFEVLGAADIDAMLGLEMLKDQLGCSEVACAVEIAGALGGRHLLAGRVTKLGTSLVIVLKIIDTHDKKVTHSARFKGDYNPDQHDTAVDTVIARLLGERSAPVASRAAAASDVPWKHYGVTPEVWHEYEAYVSESADCGLEPHDFVGWHGAIRPHAAEWNSYREYACMARDTTQPLVSFESWWGLQIDERYRLIDYLHYRAAALHAGREPPAPMDEWRELPARAAWTGYWKHVATLEPTVAAPAFDEWLFQASRTPVRITSSPPGATVTLEPVTELPFADWNPAPVVTPAEVEVYPAEYHVAVSADGQTGDSRRLHGLRLKGHASFDVQIDVPDFLEDSSLDERREARENLLSVLYGCAGLGLIVAGSVGPLVWGSLHDGGNGDGTPGIAIIAAGGSALVGCGLASLLTDTEPSTGLELTAR